MFRGNLRPNLNTAEWCFIVLRLFVHYTWNSVTLLLFARCQQYYDDEHDFTVADLEQLVMDFGDGFCLSDCFPVDLYMIFTHGLNPVTGSLGQCVRPAVWPGFFSANRRIFHCNLLIALKSTFYTTAAYNWNFIMSWVFCRLQFVLLFIR